MCLRSFLCHKKVFFCTDTMIFSENWLSDNYVNLLFGDKEIYSLLLVKSVGILSSIWFEFWRAHNFWLYSYARKALLHFHLAT